jgi:hypothetical protein
MSKFKLLNVCLGLMESQGESFSTGVTLFVHGVTISGDLIHPVSYLRGMSELLEAQTDGEGQKPNCSNVIGKCLREFIDSNARTSARSSDEGDNDDRREHKAIYLKDITLWNLQPGFQIRRSFLALDLESVDGFIWGKPNNDG